MAIRIDPLDPSSERDLEDAAAMITAYRREVLGVDEPASPIADLHHGLRLDRDDIAVTMLLCREGDRAVGVSAMEIWSGHGNEHLAFLEDFYVLPPHRRAGLGRRLLAENVTIPRAGGRTIAMCGYYDGNVDGAAFVKALGMRLANSDRQNRVRVTDLDRALLESWNRPVEGYSLVRFDGRTPDDIIDAVVVMQDVMNDAPRSESMGGFVHTAEHRRASEREMVKRGVEYWYAGVRHDASGTIAGYSDMTIKRWMPWLISQEDTAVHPDHRGRSIGRWLKAVNALRVLDERSDARVIETWNDGSNRWMLDINTAMGFRPVAKWIEAELDL